MRDFHNFLEKNQEKIYTIAQANCEHDKDGHGLFSKNDPWMKDTVWDNDLTNSRKTKEA